VQAFNEFMVFGTTAVTALASGVIFSTFGWQWVNLGTVIPIVLATAAAFWLSRRREQARSPKQGVRRAFPAAC
jgi:membrane protein implicated in regulation of membrane protease activity